MAPAVKILPHYTYDEYCMWEGRWELIEGIPYAMSPAPAPRHQMIGANIIFELKSSIKNSGCKDCNVFQFIDIKVADDTILQPDVLVVCKPITKKYLDFPATLVVEILSPSTAMKDRNNKFYIYQSQKIPYYLIVDVDKNEIEVYHLKENGEYQLEKIDTTQPYHFNFDNVCNIAVTLDNIWK